jgi:hypothetical protein
VEEGENKISIASTPDSVSRGRGTTIDDAE